MMSTRKSRNKKSTSLTGRQRVCHNYHDHAQVNTISDGEDGSDELRNRGPRGGVSVPFPSKLHVMLSKVEDDGLSDIVSWQPHGRCFIVHKPKEFVSKVMPSYFRQSKLTSFQRQLNLYGFSRITAGRDRGGYYHELFLRDRLFLCQNMSRMRIKGTGIKSKASPETEPNFYKLPLVKQPNASVMALNRSLEIEVFESLEEGYQPSSSKRNGDDKKKKKKQSVTTRTSSKNQHLVETQRGYFSSSRSSTYAPAMVTPPSYTRPLLTASFDSTDTNPSLRRMSQSSFNDLCSPLIHSVSLPEEDTRLPSTGDEVGFEGQHFHYLTLDDVSKIEPPPSLSLEPTNGRHVMTYQDRGLSESSLSVVQTLQEPILTPSSSSSSLDDNLLFEINPSTVFQDNHCIDGSSTEKSIENDLEEVDIDAEFALLAASG